MFSKINDTHSVLLTYKKMSLENAVKRDHEGTTDLVIYFNDSDILFMTDIYS